MMRLNLLRPTTTRVRLWQAGVALAIAILAMAAANQFVSPDKALTSDMLGMDFLPFYAGGTFARTGHIDLLYNVPATRAFEQKIAAANGIDLGTHVGPFWNPPFYAWYLAPFSMLPYRMALAVWTMVNVTALIAAILLLIEMLPAGASWKSWALVPLLAFVSMPFIQAISHGQNTFMSLLLLCLAVTAWRSRKAVMAGVFCGLLMYKPQLAAVLSIAMTLSLGWRTWIGLASVLFIFAMITVVAMP
ncbi:MAG: DUF2029 domain-containing protein, partial [Phycisphaerae bacterium]|nr:DUF2029 domain-containing protein [Phycisphaerae bacterium]